MSILKTILVIVCWTLFVALVFTIVVLIASLINNVGVYEQLRLWFGSGSEFAKFLGVGKDAESMLNNYVKM